MKKYTTPAFRTKLRIAESTSPILNGPRRSAFSSSFTSPGARSVINGSMMPLRSPSTTPLKATPMITAVASSTTLPRMRKSRNPLSM